MAIPSGTIVDNRNKIKEKIGNDIGDFYVFTEHSGISGFSYEERGTGIVKQNYTYTSKTRNTAVWLKNYTGKKCVVYENGQYYLMTKDAEMQCKGWKSNYANSSNDFLDFSSLPSGWWLKSEDSRLPYLPSTYTGFNSVSGEHDFSSVLVSALWGWQDRKVLLNGIYGDNKLFWFGKANIDTITYTVGTESGTTYNIPTDSDLYRYNHTANREYGGFSLQESVSPLLSLSKWGEPLNSTPFWNKFFIDSENVGLAEIFKTMYQYDTISTDLGTVIAPLRDRDLAPNIEIEVPINVLPCNVLIVSNQSDALEYLNNDVIPENALYIDLSDKSKTPATEQTESTDDDENGENGKPTGTEPETPYNENTENILGNLSSRYYVCDKEKVNQIVNSLWNGLNWEQSFFNNFTGLFDNLNELIISLHWLPIVKSSKEFGTLGEVNARIGAFDLLLDKEDDTSTFKTDFLLNYPSKDGGKWAKPIEVARFTIKEKFNSYLDFAPWTQMKLFLPFVGFVDIDTNIYMEENKTNTLLIECKCDLITGDLTYFIKKNNTIVQIETANCKVDIPISVKQSRSFEQTIADAYTNAVLGNASNTVGALKTSGATKTTQITKEFASGVGGSLLNVGTDFVNGLNFEQPQPTIKGCASATSKLFLMNYVALYITRPIYNRPKDYAKKFGFPSNHQCKISDAIGYNEVNSPQIRKWTKAMSDDEINEIYSILSNGFIVRSE